MPEDECLIEAEPMFCFETAVKLLYWSGFVYEDDEVLCKIAMCLKLVTMLGVTTERVMCCCAGVDLCVNNTMR